MTSHILSSATGKIWVIYSIITIATAFAGFNPSYAIDEVPEISPGIPDGYLQNSMLPNSILLLPLPPAENSFLFALDEQISRNNLASIGSPRWDLAAQDADLSLPHAVNAFSCALDVSITEQDTPRLYLLLRRVAMDAAKSTYPAKQFYMRPRPFMLNNTPTCTPSQEAWLRTDGSYPSGHSAIAWACALTLNEISPESSAALFARAWAFGQSRVICNVHWQSDVNQGHTMGRATFARLKLNSQFISDLEAARAELQAARIEGLKPTRDCRWEAEVLGLN